MRAHQFLGVYLVVLLGCGVVLPSEAASPNIEPTQSVSTNTQKSKKELVLPSWQYWLGGATGTLVGFGIGHGIVGEYHTMGRVFTGIEIAALAIPVVAAGITAWAIWDGEGIDTTFDQIIDTWSVFLWIGVGLYAAFRVWEIIDLWVRIAPKLSKKRKNEPGSVAILPVVSPSYSGFAFCGRW